MFQKKVFYICVLLFVVGKVSAQVNLQTGSATFSLPIFSWKDDKSRLYSSVTLSYNSGNGLKVNDVASNVGQGWSLITGGMISRMQVGEPDDQWGYDPDPNNEKDIKKYPNGIMYATIPAVQGCPDALRKYPIYKNKNQVYKTPNLVAEDKQVDYFSFVLNGKAGMFILDKSTHKGIPVGDTKMQITFIEDRPTMEGLGYRTTIRSFTIIDVDGLIYEFNELSGSKVLEMNHCDASLQQKRTLPKFKSEGVFHESAFENSSFVRPWIVTGWYLTKIEDPLTHRTINYHYKTPTVSDMMIGEDISFNVEGNYALITHKRSVSKSSELDWIDFQDGHKVTIKYSPTQRFDFPGKYSVSAIDVSYQNRYLSRHLINTSYFILNRYGTPVTEYQQQVSRLCLLSVQKLGVDLKEDTPPYKFDYHMGEGRGDDDYVPAAFTYAKDNWGFYNGLESKGFLDNQYIDITTPASAANYRQLLGLCFARETQSGVHLAVKENYAKNGLLKQIIYPTGGTLYYDYCQNKAFLIGGPVSLEKVGGVHVFQTRSTDGGYKNNCANPLITTYKYVLENGIDSSLWGAEMPKHQLQSSTHYEPEKVIYKYKLSCFPLGCCEFKYRYPGIISKNQSVNVSDLLKALEVVSVIAGVVSAAQTVIHAIQLIALSTGPGALIIDVALSLVNLVLTCTNNPSQTNNNTVLYNSDLNAASPLPMQFKRVEVIETPIGITPASNGKTVHEFTSDEDYAFWEPLNPTLSAKQRYAPWAYGLPKRIAVYKQNDANPIKETINTYNFNIGYSTHCLPGTQRYNRRLILKKGINIYSCKCQVKASTSQRNTDWNNENYYNDPNSYITDPGNANIAVDTFNIYTGRTELNKVLERTYQPGTGQFLESTTQYVYNDENYEVSLIKTSKSNGDVTQKVIHYTIDYIKVHGNCYLLDEEAGVTNAEINTLVQKNIISLPVETSTMLVRNPSGSTQYFYLNSTATIFTTIANNDIKPLYIKEARFNEPLTQSSSLYFLPTETSVVSYFMPPPLLNPDDPNSNTLFKTTQTFTYDGAGNLIGLTDEGNRKISNIYDYQDKYIVASVVNADPLLDKPAYSSFETDTPTNWTLSGGSPLPINGGITGSKYFPLTTGITLSRVLNSSKAYTLTFWASNTGVSVSGSATLTKSGPNINGYTYYEYNVPQGSSTVSVSGNSNIDELRVYPVMARMRTVTYDPLIGKTSECDENNRITYYEYDNLGRLRFIKDDKSNIVKMYEYNNVSDSKLNGCPTTYYNRAIKERYIKNNCGTGYQGGYYNAVVPAAMFSSTSSQQDADAQAEHWLLTNGQANANSDPGVGCTLIRYNVAMDTTIVSESCDDGYIGGNVVYSVPAGRYSSLISQDEANQQAQDEMEANAQAYANDPAHRVCTVNTDPEWEWDNINSYCKNISGTYHRFIFEKDMNPNSATYNQTRWSDVGTDASCASNTFSNAALSVSYQKTCSGGLLGTTVTYTVPVATYTSSVSQDFVDQLAASDVAANGQAYADANGSCSACLRFRITVPNSAASNLYITFTGCNLPTQKLSWNLVQDATGPGVTMATLCLQSRQLIFRYGPNGEPVENEIFTIEELSTCQ
jgi:hypothetical protein